MIPVDLVDVLNTRERNVKVYDEIRSMSGTKFDPEIVTAFFEILPRIEEIRSRYPDMEAAEMAAHPPVSAKAC